MNDPYRLPRTVIPSRYELKLEPDLETSTFEGWELVTLQIVEPLDEIVLNAAEITVHHGSLSANGRSIPVGVSYQADEERIVLDLGETVDPGTWELELSFAGILNDQLRGFYRSTFKDDTGTERVIATTQFEATDARRAFPCWDEPDLKAVFSTTLVVDANMTAISNSREIARSVGDSGKVVVEFADTPIMSTYLVAFVVGPLEVSETIDVDGIPLRIVHPPERGQLTPYALEAGAFFLRWLQDYYGIPYPGDKIDLIAIPDFAFGAMENLGAVTFREISLLLDLESASQFEQRRVADVIAHELAHMWFGDLVTMKWWNGVWLNEAFASFMEMKAVEDYRPDWNRWLAFAVDPGAERSESMSIDALTSTRAVEFEVESPEEANEMFDPLTYGKGAAVLRMIEQFLGADTFREGVGDYLRTHEYSNTETIDLWQALDRASDRPVGEIMDTWILQGGYPELLVESCADGLTISQSRFGFLDTNEATWQIPTQIRYQRSGEMTHIHHLMTEPTEVLDLGGPVDWVVANAGGHGFYRVNYSPDLHEALTGRLDELEALERFTLLDDTWAFALARKVPVASFLDLAQAFRGETEHAIWQMLASHLTNLARLTEVDTASAYADVVRSLAAPTVEKLGWEATDGEDDLTGRLRGQILALAGSLGSDPAVIEQARGLFQTVLAGGADAEISLATLEIISGSGGHEEYEEILAAYQETENPQLQVRLLKALTFFPDPDLARRTLDMISDGTFRSQDGSWMISYLISNRSVGPDVWRAVSERWDEFTEKLPRVTQRNMMGGLPGLVDREIASDVHAFFENIDWPVAAKALGQKLEMMDTMVAFSEHSKAALTRYLNDH